MRVYHERAAHEDGFDLASGIGTAGGDMKKGKAKGSIYRMVMEDGKVVAYRARVSLSFKYGS